MSSKILDYDHVANDRDKAQPDCDNCGEAGEIVQCAAPRCDINICDTCLTKNEAYGDLGVCCVECAVEVITAMKAKIAELRKANQKMADTLQSIKAIDPQTFSGRDPAMRYAYALGKIQGKAIYALAMHGEAA